MVSRCKRTGMMLRAATPLTCGAVMNCDNSTHTAVQDRKRSYGPDIWLARAASI